MSERNSLPFERRNGDSTKSEISHQLQPNEHLSIISAIAHSNWKENINLPKIIIWDSQTPTSPIDELRKNIANHDRIKPFEPLSEGLTPALGQYDSSNQNYWRSIQEKFERWKQPFSFEATRPSHAPVGCHYALNPNTGKIGLVKDRTTDEWRPDEDGFQDGKPKYYLDPRTGEIVKEREGDHTREWREWHIGRDESKDGDENRDLHYAINPDTGEIELRYYAPHERSMLL